MTVSLQALVVAVLATHVCVLLGPTPTPSAHDVGTVVVGGGGVVVVVVVVGGGVVVVVVVGGGGVVVVVVVVGGGGAWQGQWGMSNSIDVCRMFQRPSRASSASSQYRVPSAGASPADPFGCSTSSTSGWSAAFIQIFQKPQTSFCRLVNRTLDGQPGVVKDRDVVAPGANDSLMNHSRLDHTPSVRNSTSMLFSPAIPMTPAYCWSAMPADSTKVQGVGGAWVVGGGGQSTLSVPEIGRTISVGR